MIPFERAWPYDIEMKDVFANCPFCGKERQLLPLKPRDVKAVSEGRKKLLVFPCCHGTVTLVDADDDYLLTDIVVRRY